MATTKKPSEFVREPVLSDILERPRSSRAANNHTDTRSVSQYLEQDKAASTSWMNQTVPDYYNQSRSFSQYLERKQDKAASTNWLNQTVPAINKPAYDCYTALQKWGEQNIW